MFGRSAQIGFGTDLVRAERLDDVTLPRESQPPSSQRHIRLGDSPIDGTLSSPTCNDGELEIYTSKMGAFNKAKLAAKRAAVKGLPKSICDLSLDRLGAAASKPTYMSRTRGRGKHQEGSSNGTCYENT
jgi:hypothetical protein